MGGTDSKIGELRDQLSILIDGRTPITDEAYWNQLLRQQLTVTDVHNALPFTDVRRARQNLSPNVSQFFIKVIKTLNDIINNGTYGRITKEEIGTILTCVRLITRIVPVLLEVPTPDILYASSQDMGPDEIDAERLRPKGSWFGSPNNLAIAHEGILREEIDFVHSLFWHNKDFKQETNDGNPVNGSSDEEYEGVIGIQLLTTLQRLLFLNGFTVIAPGVTLSPNDTLPKHKVDSRFLWKGGIGAIKESASFGNAQIYSARTEVLRCLLACVSPTLYLTVREYQTAPPSLWLWVLTRGYIPYTANLYCSLMSTIFSYYPTTQGLLSYTGMFSSSGQEEAELVAACLQLLCILVDFNFQQPLNPSKATRNTSMDHTSLASGPQKSLTQTPVDPRKPSEDYNTSQHKQPVRKLSSDSGTQASYGQVQNGTSAVRNAYRLMLAGMKQPLEAEIVLAGTARLLRFIAQNRNTYLKNLSEPNAFHQELLILFWHLVTLCPAFTRHICSRCDANQLLTPFLMIMVEASAARRESLNAVDTSSPESVGDSQQQQQQQNENDTSQDKVGLLHLCSFILLLLSSEREFAVKLNAPYKEKFSVSSFPVFEGSYADLIVLAFHRIIIDTLTTKTQDSLIDMLLTVLCNVSAYIKSFCLESCIKLMSLVSRFSKPSWLFKAPYHYHNWFFLLDLLNNAIQYQYEGNLRLIYAILRQKNLFLDFQALTLTSSGLSSPNDMVVHTNYDNNGNMKNVKGSPYTDSSPDQQREDSTEGSPAILSAQEMENWQPTEAWFLDWKSKAPILTILRLINCLLPMVEAECLEKGLINQDEVLDFLKKTTMVGLLPVPHAIIIRNYHPNAFTALWFTTYTWGVIVSRCSELCDESKIRFLATYQVP